MKEYELLLRKELFPHWIIYTLLFSIIVLSILKYRKEVVFLNLKSVLFNPPANISFSKDETSFFGLTHWLLLINYFLVSALATYMILIYYEYSDFWLVLLPSAYFIFHTLALFFAGLL